MSEGGMGIDEFKDITCGCGCVCGCDEDGEVVAFGDDDDDDGFADITTAPPDFNVIELD
jgi:alpha-tubulin suppressor-like RCC1 family protein